MAELVTLVDARDNIVGTKDRELLTDNDRWRIAVVWVIDPAGNVLIARRAANKKINPNLWGPAAAGTVQHGDSYEDTAVRELLEEIGVSIKKLTLEEIVFFKSSVGSRACGLFRSIVYHVDQQLNLQTEEVAEVKWLSLAELKADYQKLPSKYVPSMGRLLEYYGR